ncbi:ABC transporter ATP-binding protein [Polycladidibacter stylochi]|uniref:ABC transporter ATP-binding protein n=1 Tax=Polycladidibacter stylochi TaxID=1807766 RepID=UPI000831B06C|nr:ABC transporter ATP-binding protein [Pseudovibrio stylochi]
MTKFDVELDNVSKRFGEFTAVDNVNFKINKGEFFSLLGPSGCGKTTLMRMISGFEAPSEGTIRISGKDVTHDRPYERPTNLVFQHLALFPHLTIAENIAFGLRLKKLSNGEIDRRVDEMLELVRLPGLGNRKISQLSGGQKQRIAIARALVNRPAVLLLDEPLAALDLKLREQMQLELKRIQSEIGTTFIYVTHDQSEAITMSDVIAVVNKGKIEQMADATTIYEKPQSAFVANFIGETNLLEGEIASINGDATVVVVEGVPIKVKSVAGAHVGQKAHVSVRPEKIIFDAIDADSCNHFEAVIDNAIYMGNYTHYQMHLGQGLKLGIDVQNATHCERKSIGESVHIAWSADLGVLLPGEVQ